LAGIYIHIPFCKQACNYCNFHFTTSLKHKDNLIAAILGEIDRRAPAWQDLVYDTIYFGGGTPSLLPIADIASILNKLYQTFKISQGTEITLEGNPDDLSLDKLNQLRLLGINRLSIGVQSFFDDDLQKLNRSHNANQAEQVIGDAQSVGFDNMSIDLIYGIPGLTDQNWLSNIKRVADYRIPHVSAYALTVEPQTTLAWQIKKHKFPPVSEEQSARQFYILRDQLLDQRFEHYEISNFARTGFISQHNSHYWQGIPYLGIGPAAHSFNGNQRRWNIANNALYIKKIKMDEYYESETLTKKNIFNELLMTGLRTSKGVDLNRIKLLGKEFEIYLDKNITKYIEGQQIIIQNNFLKATENSLFTIEGIISDLFMV